MFDAPPWTPDMDRAAERFMDLLRAEKYPDGIDPLGSMRWSSDWRIHVSNGCSELEAMSRVFSNIDEIRAGQTPTAWPAGQYDVPWAPGLDRDAEDFFNKLTALYDKHQQRSVDDLGICRWSSDYRIARGNGLSHESAWLKIEHAILDIWGILPPVTESLNPVRGRLRRRGNVLADDGGLVTPLFSSEFNLLRVRKFDPEMYARILDDLVRWRLQGSRIFLSVGGWAGFWDDAEVVPVSFRKWQFDRKDGHLRPATDAQGQPLYGPTLAAWSDFDEQLHGLCEDFARRKLVLHFTNGDVQIIMPSIDVEIAHHRRCAAIVKSVDPALAALWEIRNEYPMNSPFGGSVVDHDNMARIIREVKSILGAETLCGKGAALSEEPDDLLASAHGGDVCFNHTSRDPFALCLKRTLGLRYWEGDWGAFPYPFINGEPKPMNVPPFNDGIGDDGYAPTERVDQLIALHAMIALTSQAGNLFTGASVKLKTYPSLMPGYREIPAMLGEIPEDIASWDRETAGGGAILYFTKGDRFMTSTDESWNTAPPRRVDRWTMYTGRGPVWEVLTGTGNPPQGRTGFLVGLFA